MKKGRENAPEISTARLSSPAAAFASPSSEKRSILRERAKILAKETDKQEKAGAPLEVLVFLLAHETYAVEISFIWEVYPLTELTPLPCTPGHVLGIISIRGRILTVIDMKKFFNIPGKGITDLNRIVVVRSETLEMGILADEILGIRTIYTGEIHPPPPEAGGIHMEYVKGISCEGVILLDMDQLLRRGELVIHEEVQTKIRPATIFHEKGL